MNLAVARPLPRVQRKMLCQNPVHCVYDLVLRRGFVRVAKLGDAEANDEHFAATAATVAQQASEASSAATVAKESSFAACCADSSAEETALRTEANEFSQTIASYAAAHNALVAEMRSSAAVEAEAMTSYLSEASSSLVATSSAELNETSTMLSMHCASAARMSEECGAAVDVAASAAETAIATRASAAIESNEASMEALLHCMGAGETNAAAVKDAACAAAKLSHTAASESAATRRVDAMALFAAHAAAATDAATSSQAATLARIFEIDAAISTFGEARSAAVSEAAEANSEGCVFANECVVSASTAAAAAADAMNAGVSSAQELLERSVRGTLVRDVASVHAAMVRGAEMHGAKIGAARDVIAVNCEEVHIHCDTHIAEATAVAVDSIAQGVDAEISVCVLSFCGFHKCIISFVLRTCRTLTVYLLLLLFSPLLLGRCRAFDEDLEWRKRASRSSELALDE